MKKVPITTSIRHFLGLNLLRFTTWHRKRQVQHLITTNAFQTIKQLWSIRKSLSAGRLLIGVLLTEHFGDIVACEPIILWLRKQYPAGFIVWLTRPAYVELLKHHPQLDAIVEIGSVAACQNIIRSGVFDDFADLHIHRKFCDVSNREYVKQWGSQEVDIQNYFHHGALLEAMSLGAGLPRLDEQPHLFLSPEASQAVDDLKLPSIFVVIHARSNLSSKNWNDVYWNELAEMLVGRFGLTLVEIGLESAIKRGGKGVINLCSKLSLTESAEVIRRAVHFIGIDSGPAHFANAFQIPSVILLGHYNVYKRYMPYTGFLRNHSDSMIIQWDGPASEIPVSEVLRRFEMLWSERLATIHQS